MDHKAIEQFAIDYPDDAETQLMLSGRPTKNDVEYLRFVLSKLQGKEERTIDESWRSEFRNYAQKDTSETANQLMGSEPPKEEPVHGFTQEQGNRETADPAQEESYSNPSNQDPSDHEADQRSTDFPDQSSSYNP